MKELNINILPQTQKELFFKIEKESWLSSFYLAGGTALALLIGHRESIDFDFFINQDFDVKEVVASLEKLGIFISINLSNNTIKGELDKIKISFMTYRYPLLEKFIMHNNINICSPLDIALMKLSAISQRCAKKDFIDMNYLFKQFDLDFLLKQYKIKYNTSPVDDYHILRSLTYFLDADEEPMPRMKENIEWEDVKRNILIRVKETQNKEL